MNSAKILALTRVVVNGGHAPPHTCKHCTDIELPPIPDESTLDKNFGRGEEYAGWSVPLKLTRSDIQHRSASGCSWWTIMDRQIRRHELVCKAKKNRIDGLPLPHHESRETSGQNELDDDSQDERIQEIESVFLTRLEAERLQDYLDGKEYDELLWLAETAQILDSSVATLPSDVDDNHAASVWLKFRFTAHMPTPHAALELRFNLTLVDEEKANETDTPWQSFEGTLIVLSKPSDADLSERMTAPINVRPGSAESFELMREWVHSCESSHQCGFMELPNGMPSMLLDVVTLSSEDRVRVISVQPSRKERYIALSYCWGSEGQKVMNLENTRDSLHAGIATEKLDWSIRDAIDVTRELGFRFLWVDALCIPQDDREAKAREISRMAEIYSYASFTIYASRANSVKEGFLSERVPAGRGLRKRYRHNVVFEFRTQSTGELDKHPKVILIPEPRSSDDEKEMEPLQDRAWTLQELILPPRRLAFGTNKTTWTCLRAEPYQTRDGWVDSAGTLARLDEKMYREATQIVQQTSKLSLDEIYGNWNKLVTLYMERQISFKNDRLPAISALARVYSKVLQDEYLCGHWRSTLPASLLWMCRTRTPNRPDQQLKPSWSWISSDSLITWESSETVEYNVDDDFKVVDCKVHLKPSGDAYGDVEGADLRVRGLVCAAPPGIARRGPGGVPTKDVAKDINDCTPDEYSTLEGILHLKRSRVVYDYKDLEADIHGSAQKLSSSLHLLLIASVRDPDGQEGWSQRRRSPRGLVLLRHDDGNFSRVGRFLLGIWGAKNKRGQPLYSPFPDNSTAYRCMVREIWGGETAIQDITIV